MNRIEKGQEFYRMIHALQVLTAKGIGAEMNLTIAELAGITFDAIGDAPVSKPESGSEWRAGVKYDVGDIVKVGSTEYKVIVAHISQDDWRPDGIGVYLFEKQVQSMSPWQIGVVYKTGDLCTYNGKTYVCILPNTSQASWYPGAPGTYLWEVVK